ncbi:UNVERIFIED_CONTAM: hypothetical protein HDU68_000942 [Siphonaria sp. JEL0065]|nr:hypothetical protein HDU68_000942 [Siphonaria sp. JEL0065]
MVNDVVEDGGSGDAFCVLLKWWESTGLSDKVKSAHEAAIVDMMEDSGMTREQITALGPDCSGNTFEQRDIWYSTRCLYRKKINVATAGKDAGRGSGLSSRCRGCLANHNTLNNVHLTSKRLYNSNSLLRHDEWSRTVKQDVSYSLVLRILRNGGFIHLRTQSDVNDIRKPLSKAEQVEYLTWIKEQTHHGFRTGAELILLTEAGTNMVFFDRSDSTKKIDEIGQTVVADSWGFNRLSNSLSEDGMDDLLREILAGDYAGGDAAFRRRNGDGEPRKLSKEWEDAIEKKWNSMSVESQNNQRKFMCPNRAPYIDNRVWTLPEIARICQLNANDNGNLVCENSRVELSPEVWGVDRVVNERVVGVSGSYCNGHCLIVHPRLNDVKEAIILFFGALGFNICLFQADGRKVFATVETLRLEMGRRNIVQVDYRVATQLIMRDYFTQIRTFRNSQIYRDNMTRLVNKKSGL